METKTAPQSFTHSDEHVEFVRKSMLNRFKFRLLLMAKLPMAWLSGMRIVELDRKTCKVQLRYKWMNRNPFRSIFWAVLGMAAEMSSGAFIMMYTHKTRPSVATLVVSNEARYMKKAVGKITFVCHSGEDIANAVKLAIDTGEAQTVVAPMTGFNEQGETVCECSFTWSFKARSPKN